MSNEIFTALPDDSSLNEVFGLTQETWGDPKAQAERDRLLDEELSKRNYPTNPKNAARAGWYAALRFVASQMEQKRQAQNTPS